jgi:type II secretory pathway pseudopilin PulG
MNWLKRNLYLVLGVLAALVLLGLTGFYLFQQRQKEQQVTAALEAQIAEWKRLTNRKPSANEENIEAARKEQARLTALLQTNGEYFVPTATFTNMDSATFKTLLETTIYDLERSAQRNGVSLPPRYSFTFGQLRASVVFKEAELLPLAFQIAEIRALCEILFEARVHALTRIRRVPISKQETGASEFLTGSKITTNTVTSAVVTPYELTFQGFSSELAAVLTGLQHSRHAFVVKMIDVAQAPDSGPALMTETPYGAPIQGVPMTTPTQPQSGADMMRQRYGQAPGGARGPGAGRGSEFTSRYGAARPGAPPTGAPLTPGNVYAPAPTRRGPETVLEEKQLKVTLTVDAVRLPLTVQ